MYDDEITQREVNKVFKGGHILSGCKLLVIDYDHAY